MTYIDHPVLYNDNNANKDWQELIERSNSSSAFWRKYAKRKMRRIIKELLNGVRPRIDIEGCIEYI